MWIRLSLWRRSALDWAVYNRNTATTRELSLAGAKPYNPYGTQKYNDFVTYSKAESKRPEIQADLPRFNQILPLLKRKIKICSYRNKSSNMDHAALFRQHSKEGGSMLSLKNFAAALRKSLQICPKEISESDIRVLFTIMDKDGVGEVAVSQILITLGLMDESEVSHYGVTSSQRANEKGTLYDRHTMENFTTQGTIGSMRWGNTTSRTTRP